MLGWVGLDWVGFSLNWSAAAHESMVELGGQMGGWVGWWVGWTHGPILVRSLFLRLYLFCISCLT